jgi:1-acyl-sn-glycerol-3-phosphate acyltransferase
LLYALLKFPAFVALYFYCRNIKINQPELLKSEGPLLLASNHPNSFLDAIIFASLFKRPIYSLTRGDAFAGRFFTALLRSMNMVPVYRASEGAENLERNYKSFSSCINVFKKNGIVLIFSEGRCINEWHLRSLKKGTARLALTAWEQNIPVKVLPVGINYSSFRIFGKNLIINFGEAIQKENLPNTSSGKSIQNFNNLLNSQLKKLVYEIDSADKATRIKKFNKPVSSAKKILLFLPSVIGYIIHYPLYIAVILAIKNKAEDHFDSIVVGLLFILYLPYILIITALVFLLSGNISVLWLWVVMPLSALAFLQIKKIF